MSLSTLLNYLRPLQHLINKPLPAVQGHPSDPWFGSGGCSQCPSPLSRHPWFPRLSHSHSQLQYMYHKTFRHKHKAQVTGSTNSKFCSTVLTQFFFSNQLHGTESPKTSHSCGYKILHFQWNPKFPYCNHNKLSLVPILSEINSVHTPTSCVFKIHFTTILFTHTYDFQVISTLWVLHKSDAHLFSDLWFICLVFLETAARSSCQSSFHYYSVTASCIITTYMVKLPLCSPWRQARGAEVWLHSFLTSALDGAEFSASHLGHLPQEKYTWSPLNRRLVGSGHS